MKISPPDFALHKPLANMCPHTLLHPHLRTSPVAPTLLSKTLCGPHLFGALDLHGQQKSPSVGRSCWATGRQNWLGESCLADDSVECAEEGLKLPALAMLADHNLFQIPQARIQTFNMQTLPPMFVKFSAIRRRNFRSGALAGSGLGECDGSVHEGAFF